MSLSKPKFESWKCCCNKMDALGFFYFYYFESFYAIYIWLLSIFFLQTILFQPPVSYQWYIYASFLRHRTNCFFYFIPQIVLYMIAFYYIFMRITYKSLIYLRHHLSGARICLKWYGSINSYDKFVDSCLFKKSHEIQYGGALYGWRFLGNDNAS